MTEIPKNPALSLLDNLAVQFYQAIGMTLTRWQFTEAGMFLLAHAIMATEYKYSSRAFFRFKNADAKFQFLDKLCEAHFPSSTLENEWNQMRTQLSNGIKFRNCVAHYEISYVSDVKHVPDGDPPVVLVPHHLDHRIHDEPMIRAVNLTE